MSDTTSIQIDERVLVPTRVAACRVGLSYDYVARLARQQKVYGVKIGRSWYVEEVSLRRYLESTELEKQVRTKFLKDERRRELATYALAADARPFAGLRQILLGSGQTVSVLTLALLLGVLLHSAVQYQTTSYVVALLPQAVTDLGEVFTWSESRTATAPAEIDTTGLTAGASVEATGQTQESTSTARVVATGPLLLLGMVDDMDRMSYVRSLFSDPVAVELSADGVRGTVVADRADGRAGTPVEVLLVPNDIGTLSVVQVE